MELTIRWMQKRELSEVLEIENQEFEFPWEEGDFCYCLQQTECCSAVCVLDEKIVGYMVYYLHEDRIEILNFVVSKQHQREGVASQMMQTLIDLSQKRQSCIEMCLVEINLNGQLFLKSQGFKVVSILDEFFEDWDEDTYLFRFNYIREQRLSVNRISQFYNVEEKNEFE